MKPRGAELSPKPDRVSLFGNTAENPFPFPPVSSDVFHGGGSPSPPRGSPAPSEFSYFRAQVFPPGMRAPPTTLAWSCGVNTSLLWKKLGEASNLCTHWGRVGRRAAPAGLASPADWWGTGRGSALRAGCGGGHTLEEGTVWVSPSTVEAPRSLGAGGQPSLLPQAPGVREKQPVTIWLPFGDPRLFSAQLRYIREGRVLFGLVFL